MSEAFVDVTWRGLEVGRRVKLRAIYPTSAYLDHGAPMPVGTTVMIKTDDGIEIAARVGRVHEQVGGSSETPGMYVVPRLEGAGLAWWQERAEPEPEPVAAAAAAQVAVVRDMVEAVPEEVSRRNTVTMSKEQVAAALAAAGGDAATPEPIEPDAGKTEVMAAISEDELVAMGAKDPPVADDGRATMVMSAVDVSTIVEAAGDGGGESDDDGPSGDSNGAGTGDGNGGNGESAARGKAKRGAGKRGKRKTR